MFAVFFRWSAEQPDADSDFFGEYDERRKNWHFRISRVVPRIAFFLNIHMVFIFLTPNARARSSLVDLPKGSFPFFVVESRNTWYAEPSERSLTPFSSASKNPATANPSSSLNARRAMSIASLKTMRGAVESPSASLISSACKPFSNSLVSISPLAFTSASAALQSGAERSTASPAQHKSLTLQFIFRYGLAFTSARSLCRQIVYE